MEKPKENKINFGVIIETEKRPTDYQLGAVVKEVLQEDGQWLDFDPECEIQKGDDDDWMDCVSEAETNSLKLLLKRKFNIDGKLSVRFRAKMSGTTRNGNTLFNVANSERKDGFNLKVDWDRDRSMEWGVYYRAIPSAIISKAKKTLLQFEFNYETVPTNHNALKEALKYAPVQVIGYAWASENEIYYDYGYTPNHSFLVVGYVEGQYWLVYDSYPTDFQIDDNSPKQEFIKKLDWNFQFGDAMIHSIKLKDNSSNISLISKLKTMFKNLVAYMDNHGLHIWYVDDRGKQEIPLTTIAEKALFMQYVKEKIIKTTTYGELSGLANYSFF